MSTPASSSQPATSSEPALDKNFRIAALALILLTWLLQIVLIWSVQYPPLLDYPNHLARHYLEYLYLSGQELPEFYRIHYRVLPNLGGDFVIPPLMTIFAPATAGKIFLSLSLMLYWIGPALFFCEAHGWSKQGKIAALVWVPLGLTYQFFFGYINFYSGIGLAFLVLAHFLWLRRQPTPPLFGWLLQVALIALLFLWHLGAWGTWVVVAGVYTLHDMTVGVLRGESIASAFKRHWLTLAALFPSVVLLALYSLNKVVDEKSAYIYGDVSRKLALPLSQFRGYFVWSDALAGLLWLAALALFFSPANLRLVTRHWAFYAAVTLLILYAIIPFVLGGMTDSDSRVLPALLILTITAATGLPVRISKLGLILLFVCVGLRYGPSIYSWHRIDNRLQQHAQALEILKPGDRVLSLTLMPVGKEAPERCITCWAIVQQNPVFLSDLFAYPDQQPLKFVSPYKPLYGIFDHNFDLAARLDQYDYFWIHNPNHEPLKIPPGLERVYDHHGLTVWRIPHSQTF